MAVNAAAALVPTNHAQSGTEYHTPRQYQTELFLEARKRNVSLALTHSALLLWFRSAPASASVKSLIITNAKHHVAGNCVPGHRQALVCNLTDLN